MRPLAVRTHPLVFGVAIFLASELMFFAGLFAAYFDLRSGTAVWPPSDVHLNVLEATIGTAFLAISSGSMIGMTRALDRTGATGAYPWLFAGILSAIIFIGIAVKGWQDAGFTIASHAYGSTFYAMTGLHLLHVAVGVILLGTLFFGLRSPALTANHRAGAEAIMYYWHFVFIVWLGIWGTIYFLR
ncbi:MAG: cytochrome c oxidase subunit 3 [Candidatus Eremiobacteraeota bacterium]|nr:cytochrome c oxidase subunit 3 [Candidatus Eremiobacteraeota bacterium]